MKRILLFAFFACTACTVPQHAQQTKQTFTFDYTPKQEAKTGSVSMLLALVNPYYVRTFQITNSELFNQFRDAIGKDIEELIVSKGFSLKGPYGSFDDMIFDDKKTTDMVIQIEMDPQFTAAEGQWKSQLTLLGTWAYSYTGKVSLVGKINFSGIEPLTNQKIWSKSVSIQPVENILIQTSQKYDHPLQDYEIYQDPGIYNAVGKALANQYTLIMDKIAAQLDAEEFISLKGEIKELKSKKGY